MSDAGEEPGVARLKDLFTCFRQASRGLFSSTRSLPADRASGLPGISGFCRCQVKEKPSCVSCACLFTSRSKWSRDSFAGSAEHPTRFVIITREAENHVKLIQCFLANFSFPSARVGFPFSYFTSLGQTPTQKNPHSFFQSFRRISSRARTRLKV